jgi:CO/xanthine dehydrogenase FAD-binding subunit
MIAKTSALLAALCLAACAGANQQSRAQATVSGETPPATEQEAKAQCWMRYENKSAPRDLDKRMALVDQCIAEKMKQLPRAQ